MEFLSSSQLKQYEEIINQIECEHKKFEKLKEEVERENNRLIISRLSKSKPSPKIAHVNVKIFSDIFELMHLYSEEIKCDVSSFLKRENCKFYLIEIFILNALQKKIKDFGGFINISIRSDNFYQSKSIYLSNDVFSLYKILAVDERIIDSQVSVVLVVPGEESNICISLDTISIDISYHFEMIKVKKALSKPRKILELIKTHNPTFDILEIRKPLLLDYHFLINIDNQSFVKMFIKNCYHRVDLELFSELHSDSKNTFSIKFSTGLEKHSLSFDRKLKKISLRSNVNDLFRLKNYFCRLGCVLENDRETLKKDLKELLATYLGKVDKDGLCMFYNDLRMFWTKSHK